MTVLGKRLLYVAMLLALCGLVPTSAMAARFRFEPGGEITMLSDILETVQFEGGGYRITCEDMSLRGELNRGEMEKTPGFAVGQLRGGRVFGGCIGGTVELDFEPIWNLRYSRIEGSLPDGVTHFDVRIEEFAATSTALGVTCNWVGPAVLSWEMRLVEAEDRRGRPARYRIGRGVFIAAIRSRDAFCPEVATGHAAIETPGRTFWYRLP